MKRMILLALILLQGYAASAETATGTFIRVWQLLGPFPSKELTDPLHAGESPAIPVATNQASCEGWKILRAPSDVINLESLEAFGPQNQVDGFAYTEIEAAQDADMILGIGSDDGIAVWWNGRLILVHDALRSVNIGEDQIPVRMSKGRNRLMLKIHDAGGGWGFAADLRPADFKPVDWKAIEPGS
jgi:hypothetical protein